MMQKAIQQIFPISIFQKIRKVKDQEKFLYLCANAALRYNTGDIYIINVRKCIQKLVSEMWFIK